MRGIVMGIQNGSCVVLKDDGTFADLPDRGYQIGQKITIQTKKSPILHYAALAASLLLVCLSGFGVHLYRLGSLQESVRAVFCRHLTHVIRSGKRRGTIGRFPIVPRCRVSAGVCQVAAAGYTLCSRRMPAFVRKKWAQAFRMAAADAPLSSALTR